MSFTAIITADAKGFERAIDQAQSKIDGLEKTVGQRLSSIGDKFTDIGRKASVLSAAIVAAGGASFKMAADFEDALGATDQVFNESSEAVKEWANSLGSQYGVAKKEALEYANLMGTMLKNIGQLTEDQASKQSQALVELAGDLTAMFGGSTQEAVTALTASLRGNNIALTRYGVAINDALIKNKALELGLISGTSEMSLQAKQAATLALIWEQTADAQGQAGREASSASGAMRAFRTEVANLSTEIGEVLLPIITPMITKLSDLVGSLRALSPEMQSMIVGVAGVTAAVGPALAVLGKLLQLLPAIKVAIAALTGPVGLTVAAIAGATALIVANWDSIKEYFTSGDGAKVFETIKSMAVAIKDDVVTAFNAIKTAVKTIWNAIGDDIINIFGNALQIVMAALEVFVNTFKNVAQILHGIFTLDFRQALEGLKNLFTDIFNGIKKIVFSAVSVISSTLAGVFDFIGLNKWAEGLRSFSDKLSPSIEKVREETEKATEATEEQVQAVGELETVTGDLTSTIGGLMAAQEQLIKDGSDVNELIRRTSDEITVLTKRLEGLRSGEIVVKNVYAEIEETEKRVRDLSSALDLLTGGRELTIDLNIKSGAAAFRETDLFKGYQELLDESGQFIITPEIDTSLVEAGMGRLVDETKVLSMNIGNMIGYSISDMMRGIGVALAEGENIIDVIGKSLLATIGDLAVKVGEQMIAFGTAGLALKSLIHNPIAAIAAGSALVALGSAAASAISKTIDSHTGGGGYAGGASSYQQVAPAYAPSEYRGAYREDYTVEFRIGTNELVGVLDMAEQRKKRL